AEISPHTDAVMNIENARSGFTRHAIRGVGGSNGGQGIVGQSGYSTSDGFAFYAEKGGYSPFTGQHDAFLAKDSPSEIGDIVYDVRVLSRNGINDTVTEVAIGDQVAMKSIIGIITSRGPFGGDAPIAAR